MIYFDSSCAAKQLLGSKDFLSLRSSDQVMRYI